MRKAIIIISLLLIAVMLSGCAEEISCEPVDVKYIEAYDDQVMVYGYVYDWVHGEYKYMPTGTKIVHHDPVYRVRYRSVFSNGCINEYWQTVTEEEYQEAVEQMRRADDERRETD